MSISANSSIASNNAMKTPVVVLDEGIARTAATDSGPHLVSLSTNSSQRPPSIRINVHRSAPPHDVTSRPSTFLAGKKNFASYVIAICIISNFLVEVGDYLIRTPFIRILEEILCRQYWESHDPGRFSGEIDERWCKVASIQAELSMLKGWDLLFSSLPTILLTIPMGVVADRYGRKKLLFIALCGLTLTTAWMQIVVYFNNVINVRWFWAANAFLLIGGGPAVINNMFFIILADVTSEEQRVMVFFRYMATNLLATVLAVPLAWYLVKFSLWLPMLLGLACVLIGTLLTLLVPETLNEKEDGNPESAPLLSRQDEESDQGEDVATLSFKDLLNSLLAHIKQLYFIIASPILIILAATFFANSLGQRVLMLLLQFTSNRFGKTLAEASLLIPLSSTINFVVLLFVLPWINSQSALQSTHSAPAKDLTIARVSIIILIIGLVGIALSPNIGILILAIVVYALGAGYSGASRSLVTSFVEHNQVGRLYAMLAILDMTGTLISGPTLSKLYSWGLNLGGLWTGIPFLFSAVLFSIVGIVIWIIRLPETSDIIEEH